MGTMDVSSLAVPLWIMAALSILEALLLIGMGIGGYLMYSRVMTLVNDLETRQIAPIREKVDAVYDRQLQEIGGEEELQRISDAYVARCLIGYDEFAADEFGADELVPFFPVGAAGFFEHDDGEGVGAAGLDEGEDFESFVHRSETAGE